MKLFSNPFISLGIGVSAAALCCSLVWADEDKKEPLLLDSADFSGKVKLGSNYIFRAISQASDEPQIQGEISWANGSGFYTGVWASNTAVGGERNSMELDPYIGYAGTFGDTGLSYDLGIWAYFYPGSRFDFDGDGTLENADFDFWETYSILTYDFGAFSLTGSLWYADNYFGDDFFPDSSSLAYHTIVSVPLPGDFTISGRLGRQTIDEPAGLPNQDYTYYDAGIAKDWNRFRFVFRWHDANGVKSQLAPANRVGGLVFSVTYGIN